MKEIGDAELPEHYADEAMKELAQLPLPAPDFIKGVIQKWVSRAMNDETADCAELAKSYGGETALKITTDILARITRRQDESIARRRT